jgi:ComF family protein
VARFFAPAFSNLFPDDCRVCGNALSEISRVPICSACLNGAEPLTADFFCLTCRTPFLNAFVLDSDGRCPLCRLGVNRFDEAYCFGAYEGTLKTLIHMFKYAGVRPLSGPLGRLLAAALPLEKKWDAIVPMPLHWWKRWQRGFNQSELLARELARRTQLPVVRALRRRKNTAVQAGLSHAARRQNVAGAFKPSRVGGIEGRKLLLVDDVMTTGATVNAAAAALKRDGAANVTVLTLARVDRRPAVSVPDHLILEQSVGSLVDAEI